MAKIYGLAGPDYLVGSEFNDAIAGKAGDDFLDGWLGDDRIWAGAGNDVIVGGDGTDVVAGKAGDDTIFGEGLPPGDIWNVDEFDWQGGGNDRLFGGDGDDGIYGQGGDDQEHGGAGNDTIVDRGGSNRAYGGDGNDFLAITGYGDGGRGDDVLQAAVGELQPVDTTLRGGPGADLFNVSLYVSADPAAPRFAITIADLHPAEGDHLQILVGPPMAGLEGFDSNGSGHLGDGDEHAFAEGPGRAVAQWYNIDLHVADTWL